MKDELLEVIDEKENVIGLESRLKIHQLGLLHKEIHIWFFTPNKEIIFQHRSKNKETYPDKLDSTVGGHVERGMTYEETAIKECYEETGINISPKDLIFLSKFHIKTFDESTGLTNNSLRSQYAYLYNGNINDLKVESDSAIGFESWKIDDILNISENDKKRFILAIFEEPIVSIFIKISNLL